MPLLEYNRAGEANQQWGRGWEQFDFWYVDPSAKAWQRDTRPQRLLTPETLSSAPMTALALIRDISFTQLSDRLRVDNSQEVTERLVGMGTTGLGEIFTEPDDGGKTTNYIIPIKSTPGGQLQIVVNSAWGVHWKLSEDHSLAKEYPELTKTHEPDIVPPPDEIPWGTHYVSPETLAQVTESRIDPAALARDIRTELLAVLKHPLAGLRHGNWEGGGGHEQYFTSVILGIRQDANAGIQLNLGRAMGLKTVDAFGYTNAGSSHRASKLSKNLRDIGLRIRQYHDFMEAKTK